MTDPVFEEPELSVQDQADIRRLFQEDTSEYGQDADRFLKAAKLAVVGSYNSTHDATININFGTDLSAEGAPDQLEVDQLYIVWFAKVLNHWKALISTSRPGDGYYFEVTYNGEKFETYVDTYIKDDNQVFAHHN